MESDVIPGRKVPFIISCNKSNSMKKIVTLLIYLVSSIAHASFNQITIAPNPKNNWLDSVLTICQPADNQGFSVPATSKKVSDLDSISVQNATVGIGALVQDAIANDFVITQITITRVADHVEYAPIPPTPTPTPSTTPTPYVPPVTPVETVRRAQLPIAVTRHRTSDGASGTIVFSTETLPPTVRDAWLSVAALF